MVEKEIGIKIQELRRKKGFTQEQLAEMIDLSTNHLSAIERGVYGVKLDMLVKIIDCLDCTADDLFYGSIKNSYKAKSSKISDKIDQLSPKDQAHILEVLELMVNNISK